MKKKINIERSTCDFCEEMEICALFEMDELIYLCKICMQKAINGIEEEYERRKQ